MNLLVRLILSTTAIGTIVFDCYSQVNPMPVSYPNPKAPEATMFEKFIQNPVSPFTGLHQISVPIYTIQLRGKEIPIGISYHSSGIKVDEISSDVGIGWGLQAGGLISTDVHGIPDDAGQGPDAETREKIKNLSFQTTYLGGAGFWTAAGLIEDALDEYSGGDVYYLRQLVRGEKDAEPDVYNMSGPGISAQFFLDESQVYRTIPYQNIRIEKVSSSFHVKDEQGATYKFSRVVSSNVTSFPVSTGGQANVFQPYNYSNTYYLTSVVSQLGDSANYYYTDYSYMEKTKSVTRSQRDRYSSAICSELFPNQRVDSMTVYSAVGGSRLDSILTNTGERILFRYSEEKRKDITGTVKNKLEHITIYKKINGVFVKIKDFDLMQSYVGAGPLSNPLATRLRLDSIKEVGKPGYRFDYDPRPLPNRQTFSQDHWGYFNGRGGTTLFPLDEMNGFNTGTNREPDFDAATTGILKSMRYPTGGTLSFEYEPQYVYQDSTNSPDIWVQASEFLSARPHRNDTLVFEITSAPNAIRNQDFLWHNADDGTQMNNPEDNCFVDIYGPNGYHRNFVGNSAPEGNPVALQPGVYTIIIQNPGVLYADVAYRYWVKTKAPVASIPGGGIRIKRVTNCTQVGSPCVESIYEYTLDNGRSSGITFQKPTYLRVEDRNLYYLPDGTCTYIAETCSIQTQSTQPIIPLANSQGANVVYQQVGIINKNAKTAGKTVTKFNVDAVSFSGIGFPYAPYILHDWLNGLVNETIDYKFENGTFKKVKHSKNNYLYSGVTGMSDTITRHQYYAYGAKVGIAEYPLVRDAPCSPVSVILSNVYFGVQRYKLVSSWHYLLSTTETIYANNDSLVSMTLYKRDNKAHIQVTEINTTKSSGENITTKLTYPHDYPATNPVIASMQNKNLANSVIEKTQTLTRSGIPMVVGSELITYKTNSNSIVPEKLSKLQIASPITPSLFTKYNGSTSDSRYKVEVKYTSFDSRNNLRSYVDNSGITKTYIWGYNNELVIAEVTNAEAQNVAFTSFESDDSDGGWTVSSGRVSNEAVTGKRCLDLQSKTVSKSGLASTEKYVVSLWIKTGASITITGGTVSPQTTGISVGQWSNKIYYVTGTTSITIQGSGLIDEVRLHPVSALMTTYTHKPGVGILSQSDANSITGYYEYDNLNRLSFIKDYKGNVVKRYSYNYRKF